MNDIVTQEEILLSLLQGEDGKVWGFERGWKFSTKDTVCGWEGVECDNGSVTSIVISESDLSATIPSSFSQLSELKVIDLSHNMIRGTIPPGLSNLQKLETIIMSQNLLTGLLPRFTSTKLKTLDLTSNKLTGMMPEDMVSPDSVEEIMLGHNILSGTIPTDITKMSKLVVVDISGNNLSGTIPSNIGDLLQISYLYLDDNDLMGHIPDGLGKTHKENAKEGNLLKEVWLQDNQLSGTVPVLLAELDNLINLYLDGNKLTGTMSNELCQKEGLNDDFNTDMQSDMQSDVGKEYCDSIACPAHSASFDGLKPCEQCDSPFQNPYIGESDGCREWDQREILNKFYNSTSVADDGWNGEVNWNSETFLCLFSGVKCDDNFNVIEIRLKGRGLRGMLPDEIGFLEYLELLDVSDNDLSGFLPSDLRWSPLKKLDISGNNMKGIVPPSLCNMPGVNGNGDGGHYSCEYLACPAGTYSATGRMSDNDACIPCGSEKSFTLASKKCVVDSSKNGGISVSGILGITISLIALVIACSYFVALRIHRSKKKNLISSEEENDFLTEDKFADELSPDDLVTGVRQNSQDVSSYSYSDSKSISIPKLEVKKRESPNKRRFDQNSRPSKPPFVKSRKNIRNDKGLKDTGYRDVTGYNDVPGYKDIPKHCQGTQENEKDVVFSADSESTEGVWLDVPKI